MDLQIENIVKSLTTEQKISLCSGADFWHTVCIDGKVPSVLMTDGPHGLRKEVSGATGVNIMGTSEIATCFPTAVTLASSWDKEVATEVADAIAKEAHTQGLGTVLGPGTNIKRSPLCGRNFEYFSEDPYLAAEMSTAYVQSMQSNDMGCSLKHFCANNQEYNRMSIDTIVDERALREIYLPAFEQTVKKAQPYQIMCSYNKLNGTYLSDNERMLTKILREEWGFDGIVVSDWGAVNDRAQGIKAGLDLEMPGTHGVNNKFIYKALENGELTMDDLDRVVARLVKYALKCESNKKDIKYDYKDAHEVARKAAEAGAVLLKNDNDILPLKKDEKIALIGALAKETRYQGSGSSLINTDSVISVFDAFSKFGANFEYAEGYTIKDNVKAEIIEEAVKVAKNADKVVLVMGLTPEYESEGFDRKHINMPINQTTLLSSVYKANQNVIVVLQTGSPVSMKWINETKAILNTYLGGEAVGEATYNLLYGEVNPSGKLAETFPLSLDNYLVSKYFPMGPINVQYRESIFVGYRYYDAAKQDVAFPFGYGLSYTKFEYSNLSVETSKNTATVTFNVKNIGDDKGKEVCEVYVGQKDSVIFKAPKELKGFAKVELDAGEEKTVTINLDERAFSYYNVNKNDWAIEKGEYEIMVGASSRDIRLTNTISLEGDGSENIDYRTTAPSYYKMDEIDEISADEFSVIYGKEVPSGAPLKKGEYHINTTLGEVTDSWFGNLLRKTILFGGRIVGRRSTNEDMIVNSLPNMPFRSFVQFTGGMFSHRSVDGLLMMINGHFFKGFAKMIGGLRKKYR